MWAGARARDYGRLLRALQPGGVPGEHACGAHHLHSDLAAQSGHGQQVPRTRSHTSRSAGPGGHRTRKRPRALRVLALEWPTGMGCWGAGPARLPPTWRHPRDSDASRIASRFAPPSVCASPQRSKPRDFRSFAGNRHDHILRALVSRPESRSCRTGDRLRPVAGCDLVGQPVQGFPLGGIPGAVRHQGRQPCVSDDVQLARGEPLRLPFPCRPSYGLPSGQFGPGDARPLVAPGGRPALVAAEVGCAADWPLAYGPAAASARPGIRHTPSER